MEKLTETEIQQSIVRCQLYLNQVWGEAGKFVY